MKTIYLLTDYLNRFGSKHNAEIYKGGMDKNIITENFLKQGYSTKYISLNKIDFREDNWKDSIILYSSQEDVGYYYKSYIEDIIYGLELTGAITIPNFKFLKANNNKVFMEILRDLIPLEEMKNLVAQHYGTLEEALHDSNDYLYPLVIKGAEGAMSTSVALANNEKELKQTIKKLAATRNCKEESREYIRSKKYPGYQKQSKYRRKFIIQKFLPGLNNDWKVLVFGDIYYIFERHVRTNDFRASGSGQSEYLYGSASSVPAGIFERAKILKEGLGLPHVSLDFAMYNNNLYLLEFQALYFGTVGQWRSDCFYYFNGRDFIKYF